MKGSEEIALQGLLPLGFLGHLQKVYTGQRETKGPERETQAPSGQTEQGQSQALSGSRGPLPYARLPPNPASLQCLEVHVQSVRDLGLELERRNERAADRIC